MIHTDGTATVASEGVKPGDAIERLIKQDPPSYTEVHESAGELAEQELER